MTQTDTQSEKTNQLPFRTLLSTLSIVDKKGVQRALDLSPGPAGPLRKGDFAWAQRPFVRLVQRRHDENAEVRILALKARQLGITTCSSGLNFLGRFKYPGTAGLTITQDNDTTASVYEKIRLFWETWGFSPLFDATQNTQKLLRWANGSSQQIASAAKVKLRGRTFHFLHGSEVAFWDNADMLMQGLAPSLPRGPGSTIILESTAKGTGSYFHNMWLDAVAGQNEYTPLFFPWYKHYEYRLARDPYGDKDLDDYEKFLLRLGATIHHVWWRRWAIPNMFRHDKLSFMAEYPATWQEAFIATGTKVFDYEAVAACFKMLKGERGEVYQHTDGSYKFRPGVGNLTIFRWPSSDKDWGVYSIGADPTRTIHGDESCIQVLHNGTREQVAVWHGRIDPGHLAWEIAKLGYYYNTAKVAPEIEGPGQTTIGALVGLGYPAIWEHHWFDRHQGRPAHSLGWSSNYNRKRGAIGGLIHLLVENAITIHDQQTFDELVDYSILDNGEMGNWGQPHDDTVMSLAIANAVASFEGPFVYQRGGTTPYNDIDGKPPWEAFNESQ